MNVNNTTQLRTEVSTGTPTLSATTGRRGKMTKLRDIKEPHENQDRSLLEKWVINCVTYSKD